MCCVNTNTSFDWGTESEVLHKTCEGVYTGCVLCWVEQSRACNNCNMCRTSVVSPVSNTATRLLSSSSLVNTVATDAAVAAAPTFWYCGETVSCKDCFGYHGLCVTC